MGWHESIPIWIFVFLSILFFLAIQWIIYAILKKGSSTTRRYKFRKRTEQSYNNNNTNGGGYNNNNIPYQQERHNYSAVSHTKEQVIIPMNM